MAVVKRKRKQSQFEVIHHFYKMRKEMTQTILRDFGYNSNRATKALEKTFGGKVFTELTVDEQKRYSNLEKRNEAFENWFIGHQREVVMDCLTKSTEYIFQANSIYPSIMEEWVERRLLQDKAIGQCYRLLQELQYTIEILPVDISKFSNLIGMIEKEISLLKGWRKSGNKLKPKT